MGPFQQQVESNTGPVASPPPDKQGPFEQQVEARENIIIQRMGTDSYVTHGWDAAGRPTDQAAARAAEVGNG